MKQKITKSLLVLSVIGMLSGCSKTPNRKIEFVTNSGTPVSTLIGRPGQKITNEIVTERTGYKFLGWYSDPEFTNRVSSIVSFPYADVTFYAKWGKIVSVDFITNGGTSKASIEGVEGENIELGDAPTKTNNYFSAWYTSSSLDEESLFKLEVFPDTSFTLYASWDAYPTITFDTNYTVKGETNEYAIPSISVGKGEDLSKVIYPTELANLATIDKDDIQVEFAGWFIEETVDDIVNSTQFYLNGTMPDHSITLVAKWNTLRTITYETNVDGVTIPSTSAYSGHEIAVPDRPNNPGYYLEGWFEKNEDGTLASTPFDFSSMPNRDVTLVASWTLNPVATFIDGFLIDNPEASSYIEPTEDVSFDIGTTVSVPNQFLLAHQNYTMIGWFTKNEDNTYSRYQMKNNQFIGEKSITLYARYAKTTAKVSFFDIDNITDPINTIDLNYSDPSLIDVSSLQREDCPTIEGKVVVDWYAGYENGNFVGNPINYPYTTDKDISLYAKTVDKVTLTLKIGQETFTIDGGASLAVTIPENVKLAYDSFITSNNYDSVSWFIQDGDNLTTKIYDLKVFPDKNMTLVLSESDTPFNPDIGI